MVSSKAYASLRGVQSEGKAMNHLSRLEESQADLEIMSQSIISQCLSHKTSTFLHKMWLPFFNYTYSITCSDWTLIFQSTVHQKTPAVWTQGFSCWSSLISEPSQTTIQSPELSPWLKRMMCSSSVIQPLMNHTYMLMHWLTWIITPVAQMHSNDIDV